jgi:uncharacterized membrane protein
MKMHTDILHDKVLGFGLLILSGAAVIAAFSSLMLMGCLVGVVQTLMAAALVVNGAGMPIGEREFW